MLAAGLLAKKAVEKGLQTQAVGQDEPGARLEGRDRLPDRGRPDARTWSSCASTSSATAARPASATAARCRRQSRKRHRRRQPRGGGGAERQSQLRGPHPSRGAGQLPGLAAAGRRLRPGRPHGHRPARPSRSAPARTASRSTSRTSGRRSRRCRTRSRKSVRSEMFTKEYGEVFKGDEHWQSLPVPEGDLFAWDAEVHLRQASAVLRGHDAEAGRR